MLLVNFTTDDHPRLGVLDRNAGIVVDLSQAAPALARDMLGFIALGDEGLTAARAALAGGAARIPLGEVRLLAPIPRPARNILCIGKNYRDHVNEVKSLPTGSGDVPAHPIVFTKAPSTVIGPGAPIPSYLDTSGTTDYEGELGVIIGLGGRGIARADAMAHVYGYTVLNDVTARGLQKRHVQWFLGKSIDGFCPMGPAILTADAVPDVRELRVQTRVNGELRQDGRVAELIFDIPTLIETLSAGITLEPGDLIATGTPAGVGAGFTPPKFLVPGDRVAVSIEPIGTLENPVG
ncbi:fumarylacetoacetate hydrolase family protein [Acidihalobacter ferrooxydans]|uniref:Hydrolase n=1 Tax=Acidihalobacter ferrooxydans TaxID=1765967 RepID=A0A1P8UK84_9GAMM|nr:fumarylacetoacetate hydrolase family protein [Acidihalobacter ferrooxydans]APZ44235.1 hydrolase [Acidihalobacter ferrooxydans]